MVTQREIEELINESSDEGKDETAANIRNADNVDLIMLPPPKVDEVSDVEDIDEDVHVLNDQFSALPPEVAGQGTFSSFVAFLFI